MSIRNQAGAQRVEIVLDDETKAELIQAFSEGKIRPAGALKYVEQKGLNIGGIDRMDMAEWLKAATAPEDEGQADDVGDPIAEAQEEKRTRRRRQRAGEPEPEPESKAEEEATEEETTEEEETD